MTLHHATRTVDQPARMHLSSGGAFVVVSCPDDSFNAGAEFSYSDIENGLKMEVWPDEMEFKRKADNLVYRVKGSGLFHGKRKLWF